MNPGDRIPFDPSKTFIASDLGRAVGIGVSAAQIWVARRRDVLPEPQFDIRLGQRVFTVWSAQDGEAIVAAYHASKVRS